MMSLAAEILKRTLLGICQSVKSNAKKCISASTLALENTTLRSCIEGQGLINVLGQTFLKNHKHPGSNKRPGY